MKTMKTDNLKISLQTFISWRNAKEWRTSVKTRAQMLASCGKDQTNRNGKIFVHETTDYAPIVWDSQIDNMRCTGYYVDNYQDTLVCWCVIKIAPKQRNRDVLYAPVTYSSEYEGVTIHVDNAGSLDDAKQWGEQLAEREAEESREYHAKDQAEQRIEEERERIHEINRTVIPCLRELRTVTLSSAICSMLRAKIMDYLRERKTCFARIELLTNDPWEAVS